MGSGSRGFGPKGLDKLHRSDARMSSLKDPRMNQGYYNRGGRLLWLDIEYAVAVQGVQFKRYNHIPKGIIAVSRGGMIPAVMMSHMLKVPVVAVIFAQTYESEERFEWDASLRDTINSPHNLVVDDIWDSGHTHARLHELFPDAVFTTLFYKERATEPHKHMIVNFPGLPLREGEWVTFPWEGGIHNVGS